jgi:capsular polysaccharide biosynthesis protein
LSTTLHDPARHDVMGRDGLLAAVPVQEDQPGFESIGRSVLKHPFFVAFLTVLGLIAGTAIGYLHPVSYTAEVSLIVGRTSGLAESEVPGLALAVQGLASDYARLATTSPVLSDTKTILHVSQLPGTITATPVPESSVIHVDSSAPTQAQAVALANAAGAALVKTVLNATNDTKAELSSILKAYDAVEQEAQSDSAQASLLQDRLNQIVGRVADGTPTPLEAQEEKSLTAKIAQLQTASNEAQLSAQTYSGQYSSAVPPLQAQDEIVQQVGDATSTGSNHKTYLEAGGLAGLVGGLIVGLALASLKDSRAGRGGLSRADYGAPQL